ncbi:MAG: DUF1194 domain-containing protein [Kiloniellales bacterium]|nr:DUF1194 domain-containing protein [Kiloniellales bacterium]
MFVCALFASLFQPVTVSAEDGRPVSLELALLVDVSASVNGEEYVLQANGLASAFRDPIVLRAIATLAGKGLAVTVIQWADDKSQRIAIDWFLVENEADALWIASQVETMPRLIEGGHTALSSALKFAARGIDQNGFQGLRRIIDLAGDGRNNSGPPLREARREVLAEGITINGLAIVNELPFLDRYFRDHLIGGDASFYIVAEDYRDFAAAMAEKLAREIESLPLSDKDHPKRPLLEPASRYAASWGAD